MSIDHIPTAASYLDHGPYRWNRGRWEVSLYGEWVPSSVLADHDEASGLALIGACPWASAVEGIA